MHPFGQTLLKCLQARGFDLSVAFSAQAYNCAAPATLHLPTYSQTCTLGILVANSKRLWPHFCTYIRAHPAFVTTTPNPFDAFVTAQVDECIRLARAEAHVVDSVEHDVRHYWEMQPGRMVAIQRLCHVAGLAYLDQGCHLNVHVDVGPWLALRSAIVIDLPGPDPALVDTLTNPIPEILQPHIHQALLQLLPPGSSYHTRPIPDALSAPRSPLSRDGLSSDMLSSLAAFEETLTDPGERNWRGWVALRRLAASWMGREASAAAEYESEAIEYHYTKEAHVLRAILDRQADT